MAGSEKTGLENAQDDLFEGKSCFVTPTDDSDTQATNTVSAFWEALGSNIYTESPERHDAIVAQISHVPHILAAALASYLSREETDAQNLCGNGLKDTTRIASGSPELWQEIISQNGTEILKSLDQFQKEIDAFKETIVNEDTAKTIEFLARGKEFRDSIQ